MHAKAKKVLCPICLVLNLANEFVDKGLISPINSYSRLKANLLIPKISIRNYTPRTFGDNDIEKKKDLRNRILFEMTDAEDCKSRCRGKLLAIEVTFYLSQEREIGSPRDLDNMLKIFCDTFPDYVDRAKTEQGLGLIMGNSDHTIYEIHCSKKLVDTIDDEGIDMEIFEWAE